MNKDVKHIQSIIRHIRHVQDNCLLLGERLIDNGEFHLGRELIANSMIHDYSKFFGMEFEHLRTDAEVDTNNEVFKAAVGQHNKTNLHHPERWGNISLVPDVYLAEFVCDTKARSAEFGTSYQEWLDTKATVKYGFTKNDVVYGRIMRFLNLLLDKPFK